MSGLYTYFLLIYFSRIIFKMDSFCQHTEEYGKKKKPYNMGTFAPFSKPFGLD